MFRNALMRSFLQLACLSVTALFLMTASPKAAALDECDDQYAACVEKCGTWEYSWDGVTYDYVCDQCWNGTAWVPCNCQYLPRYEWHYSVHIDYFECQPGGGHGICMCTY